MNNPRRKARRYPMLIEATGKTKLMTAAQVAKLAESRPKPVHEPLVLTDRQLVNLLMNTGDPLGSLTHVYSKMKNRGAGRKASATVAQLRDHIETTGADPQARHFDKEAAAALGWSVRTVQRMKKSLM
jgi:hypothetical protein